MVLSLPAREYSEPFGIDREDQETCPQPKAHVNLGKKGS